MTELTDHYFELTLSTTDGTPIAPQRFRTVDDAMTAAKDYPNKVGEILHYGEPDDDPVTMVVYNADGTGEVSAAFFGDDPDYYDEPWTIEEVEANRIASAKIDHKRDQ